MQTNSLNHFQMQSSGIKLAWVNGLPTEQLIVADRGTAYGHGVFETICVLEKQTQLWSFHLERLVSGCSRLYIPIDIKKIQSLVNKFLVSTESSRGVLKIIVTAGSGGRGYGLPDKVEPNIILLWFDEPNYPKENRDVGVSLALCDTRLARQPRLAGIKHLNRLEQVLAKRELSCYEHSVQEGLMLDSEGCVIEGVMSNIFAVKGGVLHTPKLDNAGVSGVMRAFLLSHADECEDVKGIVVSDMELTFLKQSDEVFVCNSLMGVWPVLRLEEKNETSTWLFGNITRQLQHMTSLNCFSRGVRASND